MLDREGTPQASPIPPPTSLLSWQQTIDAAEEEKMMPAALLNGNVVVETAFYDGDLLVCKSKLRVWYDK